MDFIIKNFKDSMNAASEFDKRNCIAIKISSFGNVENVKKYNHLQSILSIIEEGIMNNFIDDVILKQVNIYNC
jgi:hypothetical protein